MTETPLRRLPSTVAAAFCLMTIPVSISTVTRICSTLSGLRRISATRPTGTPLYSTAAPSLRPVTGPAK